MSAGIPDGFTLRDEGRSYIVHIGPIYHRLLEKGVQLGVRLQKHQLNPMGTTHGGLLMSLMDVTLGATAARVLGHEGAMATVQLSCNMLAAAGAGDWIHSEGAVDKTTRTLSFVSGRILAGDRVLLTATGIFRNPPEHAAKKS